EAVAERRAGPRQAPRRRPLHAAAREAGERALKEAHGGPVAHGVLREAQQRQHVLDLLAVEKTGTAAGDVWDSLAPQLVLELAWEHADGMRQDRDLAKCAAADVKAPDGLRDRARLPARVRRHQHADRGDSTGTASRHQLR